MTRERGLPLGQRETVVPGQPPRVPVEDAAHTSGSVGVPSPVEVVPATHPHVWIDRPEGRCPGLVIEQAQDPASGDWLAHVVCIVTHGDARVTEQGWVRASVITRA